MDQELQSLLAMLYGDKKLDDRAIASITKQWNSNYMGFRDNLKKAALNKVKQQASINVGSQAFEAARSKPVLTSIQRDAESLKPIEPKRAANDMSAIADFKQAFKAARQGGHKTFLWKKTKANPSGIFNTDLKQDEKPKAKPQTPMPMEEVDDTLDVQISPIPVNKGNINTSSWEKNLWEPVPNMVTEPSTGAKLMMGINNQVQSGMAFQKYLMRPQQNFNIWAGQAAKPTFTEWRAGRFAGGGVMGQQINPVDMLIEALNEGADIKTISGIIQQSGQDPQVIVQEIAARAQQGDQSAVTALSVLEKLTKNSQSAKLGAKLAYIQKLKGVCPEGTEKVYLRNGGCMCAQKARGGTKTKVAYHDIDKKTYEKLPEKTKRDADIRSEMMTSRNNNGTYNISHKPTAADSTTIDRKHMSPDMLKKYPEKKGCGGTTKKLVNKKKKK